LFTTIARRRVAAKDRMTRGSPIAIYGARNRHRSNREPARPAPPPKHRLVTAQCSRSARKPLADSMALDISLIVVMLISAFLAMVRGFIREILSLAGWAAVAGAAAFAYLRLTGPVQQFFNGANEILVKAGTVAAVAIVALIVVTIITTRISDKILDSKAGALDRTLGVLFGLARGLILVAVMFAFYHWWAPNDPYTRNAKSQGTLLATAGWLESLMPDNLDVYISDMLNSLKKRNKRDEEDTPAETPPNQRSDRGTLHLAGLTGIRIMTR
jgi:membrane protein required for colicin V production